MKRLGASSLLILIPLALLLGVVGRGAGDLSRPLPKSTLRKVKKIDLIERKSDNKPTPFNLPDFSYRPEQRDSPAQQQQKKDEPFNWLLIFTGVTGAATALLAWFNFQLVGVTDEMKQATAQAAQVAALGLRADRPFLLIEKATFLPYGDESVTASFAFVNRGKSPAIVTKIKARLFVAKTLRPISGDAFLMGEPFPTVGEYERCKWITPLSNTLAVSDQSPAYSVTIETPQADVPIGHLTKETFAQLDKHNLLAILHGVVRYTDVLERKHETEFIGTYDVGTDAEPVARFHFDFYDRPQRENEGG